MNKRFTKRSASVSVVGLLLVLGIAGCGSSMDGDGGKVDSAHAPLVEAVADNVSAFEMENPQMSPSDIALRAQGLVQVLMSQALPISAFQPVLDAFAKDGMNQAMHTSIPAIDGLKVGHNAARNETWAWNEKVMNDVYSTTDVGLGGATAAFQTTMSSLVKAGLLDLTGIDASNPTVTHIMQGEGWSNASAPTERIKEYTFFVPRTVNGVAVANAGVRISVHRSGIVTSIYLSGPYVYSARAGNVETAQAPGFSFARVVSKADIDARVQREYPTSTVQSLGLQYRFPEGGARAVIVPVETYAVSANSKAGEHVIHGRIEYVQYSVQDATVAPVLWPVPNPGATGDKR
jgi:hypothetical protein